jgi:hypothetical protein
MAVIRTVHAKWLRVIGQSLETAGIEAFEIDNKGENYIVSSESVTSNGAWILRNCVGSSSTLRTIDEDRAAKISLRLGAADLARLDAQGQRKRGESGSKSPAVLKLSQLLRTLGDHLDRTQASAFHIAWLPYSVTVEYEELRGQTDSRSFTAEKLQQLGSHSRFRRGNRMNS